MTPENIPDEALVRATLRGDEQAFACLVRKYLRKAMAVALEYAGTRENAEDIVQDTFGRVVRNLARFDPRRPFEPWFFTILRNTARNAAKSRHLRSHQELAPGHPASGPGPLEETARLEMRDRIAAAIDRLPPMQQSCFRLCIVEGLTGAEAAAALGLAESTVRVHVFKARRALQDALGEWKDEVELA